MVFCVPFVKFVPLACFSPTFVLHRMVAQDIASALRHLHKLEIVFRDLKPGTSDIVGVGVDWLANPPRPWDIYGDCLTY